MKAEPQSQSHARCAFDAAENIARLPVLALAATSPRIRRGLFAVLSEAQDESTKTPRLILPRAPRIIVERRSFGSP